MSIAISLRSQELIKEYRAGCELEQRVSSPISTPMDLASLLLWLDDTLAIPLLSIQLERSIELILISLRAELLHDLYLSMVGDEVKTIEIPQNISSNESLKFILLTSSGILVAACQGFDSVVTMMSIFSLPSAVILASGLIFSCFSMIAFCGFDLVKLSNSFGIKLSDAHKLLDGYCQQLKHIKLLRKKIDNYNLSQLSISQLKEIGLIVIMLEQRFGQLAKASERLDQALNNNQIRLIKSLLFGVSAALFFGGAFCTGQTVSLFILGLFIATLTPASVPVIIFSLVVGCAALTLYWYIEFPGLKILVDNWFGLNEEKIAILSDENSLTKEAKKITILKEKIISTCELKDRISEQEKRTHLEERIENPPIFIPLEVLVGKNPHSFLRSQALLVNDLPPSNLSLNM